MNVYEEMISMVEDGYRFSIDFKERKAKVGKKKFDLTKVNKEELGVSKHTTKEVLGMLEVLYREYKYSLPSERSEAKRRKYFYAVPVEELSVKQMCLGYSREVAQIRLELWWLLNLVYGNIEWTDDLGKWYWHGADKDLIVMKGWM